VGSLFFNTPALRIADVGRVGRHLLLSDSIRF